MIVFLFYFVFFYIISEYQMLGKKQKSDFYLMPIAKE